MILHELNVELGSDHHGFALDGPVPLTSTSPALTANTLVVWYADADPGFVVKTGSQWGPFEISVRVWGDVPKPIGSEWEDVVEIPVSLTDRVIVREIVPSEIHVISGLAGSYRMRIASRGRTESAARDSASEDDLDEEMPLEHYLIDLWPKAASAMQVVREGSLYANSQR